MTLSNDLFTSKCEDWETPQSLFDSLNSEFGFTLDAASSDSNAKCAKHFTKETDGLSQSWAGETVFCNPPYGRKVGKWVEKAYIEAKKPNTTVVLLIASRTDTRYFHDYLYNKAEIRFLPGRLKFEVNGAVQDRAPFPSLVAILGEKARFNK